MPQAASTGIWWIFFKVLPFQRSASVERSPPISLSATQEPIHPTPSTRLLSAEMLQEAANAAGTTLPLILTPLELLKTQSPQTNEARLARQCKADDNALALATCRTWGQNRATTSSCWSTPRQFEYQLLPLNIAYRTLPKALSVSITSGQQQPTTTECLCKSNFNEPRMVSASTITPTTTVQQIGVVGTLSHPFLFCFCWHHG
jgi:hypothetical protein